MAVSVHVPRINNNDDEVTLVGVEVAIGDWVTQGQVVAQVETAKAAVDVEAPADGFVLGILGEIGSQVTVGSVLLWLGASRDEALPTDTAPQQTPAAGAKLKGQPTGKVRLLLRQHGLDASAIPAIGDRLTAEDVRRYLAQKGRPAAAAPASGGRPQAEWPLPETAGEWRELRVEERGMLATVSWQRDHAVPAYLELAYDAAAWERYAAAFAEQHKLLLSPLLSLMAWRLARLAVEQPKLNSTLIGGRRLEYSSVNVGFTVQAGETLYLCVQREAEKLAPLDFVNTLGDLQRRAAAHKLGADETQGATIAFSSMARWKVGRHIPVLAPQTALMVAHTVGTDGKAVLGATYDHRVLNGFHVISALRKLSTPPEI